MNAVWARCGALGQILMSLLALAATVVLLGLAATHLPPHLRTPVAALGMWGGVLAGAVMLRFSRTSYGEIGFAQPKSWIKTLGCAGLGTLLAMAGGYGLIQMLTTIAGWSPPNAAYVSNSITHDLLAYAAWMALNVWGTAAFGEELLFRGFILDRLQKVFGRGPVGVACAIVLQATLFGAMHGVQGLTGFQRYWRNCVN